MSAFTLAMTCIVRVRKSDSSKNKREKEGCALVFHMAPDTPSPMRVPYTVLSPTSVQYVCETCNMPPSLVSLGTNNRKMNAGGRAGHDNHQRVKERISILHNNGGNGASYCVTHLSSMYDANIFSPVSLFQSPPQL